MLLVPIGSVREAGIRSSQVEILNTLAFNTSIEAKPEAYPAEVTVTDKFSGTVSDKTDFNFRGSRMKIASSDSPNFWPVASESSQLN